jgi:hypothetical protein
MTSYHEALEEAERLSELSDDALIEELGRRVHATEQPGGQELARRFSGDFAAKAGDMGRATELLKDLGRRWWKKLEPEFMKWVCDPSNEDIKRLSGSKSIPQVAAGLATAAVTAAIAAPPAWIIVVTTLLATKICDTGLQVVCELWAEHSDRHAGS